MTSKIPVNYNNYISCDWPRMYSQCVPALFVPGRFGLWTARSTQLCWWWKRLRKQEGCIFVTKALALRAEPAAGCFPSPDVRVRPLAPPTPLLAGLPFCLMTLFKYRFLSLKDGAENSVLTNKTEKTKNSETKTMCVLTDVCHFNSIITW